MEICGNMGIYFQVFPGVWILRNGVASTKHRKCKPMLDNQTVIRNTYCIVN